MVSFAFMNICTGIAFISYKGTPATVTDPLLKALPKTSFLGIPFITWVALIMLVICIYIQEYTPFGRYIYAVGTDETIPRSVGINVDRVKIGDDVDKAFADVVHAKGNDEWRQSELCDQHSIQAAKEQTAQKAG